MVSWDTRNLDPSPQLSRAALSVFYVGLLAPNVPDQTGPRLTVATDILGGYRIQTRQPYGVELSLLASVILGSSAIPRAIRLQKPVPILLSILSTFGALVFGNAFRQKL